MPVTARIDDDALERRVDALIGSPAVASSRALLARASDQTDFVIHEAIPVGLTLMLGVPGSSKSWLAYDLAMAVARNRDWLGKRNCLPGPGGVLVLNFDNPTPECGRRFKRLGLQDSDRVWFHSTHGLDESQALLLPQSAPLLLGLVHRLGISLVVCDSLREAHTADENSSADMRPIMQQLRALAPVGKRAAVVVVHHTAKGDSTGVLSARGSTVIPAAVDACIHCQGDSAAWTKHRGWKLDPRGGVVRFELSDPTGSTTALQVKQPKAGRSGGSP
jgi:RecA-family ATPase